MPEKIEFTTEDGVKIIGDYYAAKNSKLSVILLHMMPADRSSWRELAEILRINNIQSLAIDLRGHGESVDKKGEKINYKNFSDKEHQESINDVESAAKFLIEKGATPNKIILIGASIGANLSLHYLSEHSKIPMAVLLSPGLDYHGIKTDILVKKLAPNQKILIIASVEDRYSTESAGELQLLVPENSEIKICNNLGHGTRMFEKNPELMNEVLNWINSIYFKRKHIW